MQGIELKQHAMLPMRTPCMKLCEQLWNAGPESSAGAGAPKQGRITRESRAHATSPATARQRVSRPWRLHGKQSSPPGPEAHHAGARHESASCQQSACTPQGPSLLHTLGWPGELLPIQSCAAAPSSAASSRTVIQQRKSNAWHVSMLIQVAIECMVHCRFSPM